MKKKIKAWLNLCVVIFFALAIMLSSTAHVFASGNEGSEKTARQKLYYLALKECFVKTKESGNFGLRSAAMQLSDVGGWYSIVNSAGGGAYIEKVIEGRYDDGIVGCASHASEITNMALSELGLTQLDLICDATNNHESGGLFKTSSDRSCKAIYTNESYQRVDFKSSADMKSYIDKLVTEKVFENDVPGGSLTTLTDLEQYYIDKLTFENACVYTNTPSETGGEQYLSEQIYNSSTGNFETIHYAKTNTDKVYVFNSNKMSCADLSTALTSGSPFEAYKKKIEQSKSEYENNIAECERKLAAGEITEEEAEECEAETQQKFDESIVSNTDDEVSVDEDEVACYNAASSLGWIICPVLTGLTSAMEGLYNNFVVPALTLESKFVSNDSGTFKAWSIFRDFANVIFVIFFLIIIVSQLTGYGIDNYGIKKSLPKLIIAAIIVNLSFVICQIAVDVSNIVGSSLGELLKSTAAKIDIPASLTSNLASGKSFAAGLGALGVIAVAGLALIVANGGVGAALIAMFVPLLMGILSAVIALLFMFFLLALRKSLTIILIVISPVAFVCYILPNTKNLFDKWLKAIEGMLLLYPICSIVIGGGLLASNIILSTGEGNNNFFIALTGMLAQVMPYFFVPTLLRSSFKATGAIGAKIGGVGRRVSSFARRGAGNSIRSSDAFKSRQQRLVDASKINKFRRQKTRIENKRIKEGTRASYLGALAPNATKEERREATRRADEESKQLREYNKAQSNIYASEAKGQTATQSQQDKLAHALYGKDSKDVANRINEVASNATINASQARILAGANAGLANARGEAIKTNDMAKSGTFERIAAAQDERRNKEKDEETRANLRTQTKNFDLGKTTTLLSQLVHSDKDPKTDPNLASMIRVLTQALAATGPGKGELAKIAIDENSKPEMRRFLAGEIQNDPSLAASVKSKDAYALRYMSDINSGAVSENTKFSNWLTQERKVEENGRIVKYQNQDFVLKKDLSDDADLAKLSSSALGRATAGMTKERLEVIVNSRDYHSLFSDADRRAVIESALVGKGGVVRRPIGGGTPPTPPAP